MWCGVVCLAAMAVYISDWALIQNHRALHSLLLLVHIHTHTYTWTHFITSTYTQTFSGVVMLTCMARDVNVTVVSLFHLSCLQQHSRVLKIKQQRKRYNNRQTDRERERGWEINSLQPSPTPEVDLHGPAMMLESKGCLCITATNHLKVLCQRLLHLL